MLPRLTTMCLTAVVVSTSASASIVVPSFAKRAPPAEGYYPPANNGGSMLTTVFNTFPAGLGEPLNVIVSGNSDADAITGEGVMNYFNSIGFGQECLGQHQGIPEQANLGDGNGLLNETAVIRWAFWDFVFGTCRESIEGGNHFRYWVQNGGSANSGALFFATSYEKNLTYGHDIVENGYDFGRDLLVGNATSSANGTWTSTGWSFNTTVEWVDGLLPVGSNDINHGISIDGRVAVLTVRVTHKPAPVNGETGHGTSTAISLSLPLPLFLLTFAFALAVVSL